MPQGTYQKILLAVVLFTVVICVLRLVAHSGKQHMFLLRGEFYCSDKQQVHLPIEDVKQRDKNQPKNSSEEGKQSDEQQLTLIAEQDNKQRQSLQPAGKVKQVDNEKQQNLANGVVKQSDIKEPPPKEVKQLTDEKAERNNERQQTSPHEVKQDDRQKQHTLPTANNTVRIDQDLLKLAITQSKFDKFIESLSLSQVADLVRQMRVSNLTTKKSQHQYLKCAGILTLRKLNGSPPKLPIPVPASNQHCKNTSFQSSGPIVALSSVPGSGNSWVRQLLESATGIYTGAVYCDPAYVKAGMIGEGVDTNSVLAVKIHYWPSFVKKVLNNDKAIYIVRSPFRAILSENNRNVARNSKEYVKLGDSHVMEVDFNYANNPAWIKQVKQQAGEWKTHVMQWLNYKQMPVLIVGYENLRKDTYTELKRMLDFLGHPYSEDDVLCAVKNSSETFHRNHTKKDLQPFSAELQKFVLNEIKQVDAGLQKHNISLYHPYNSEN